ncbi:MAG: TatD family hydrolase [Treponema sp.]|nr:TatD family hydrolase [Treponema sp.]
MIFDSHFHLPVCLERGLPLPSNAPFPKSYAALTCAHNPEEWKLQQDYASSIESSIESCIAGSLPVKFYLAYGLHPQSAAFCQIKESLDFLEELLRQNKISAIGEAGFDYFTEDFRSFSKKQEEMWQNQLELAISYKRPLVIHCRKANHKLFEYSKELKKCPALLFHSFMGPLSEAKSLLSRGINGFFSFGKQMNNGNKKTIECVKNLPLENLLLETDAPFQTLKNQENTLPCEILDIYKSAAGLRNINIEELSTQLEKNASKLLGNDIK